MIPTEVKRNVRSEGMGVAIGFGIDAEDVGFLTNVLSNKLYSNKPLAVVREYTCNALDANKEAGSKRNIFISVPSDFEPMFKVRDFGAGLSEDDIRNVYIKFGKSTKRDTNEQIGLFGLGSKAGFAYSDAFNITSWYNGTCYTYTAQKNAVGKMDLIPVGSFPSDEPSGIEIAVAVLEKDISTFRETIAEFCKYVEAKIDFTKGFESEELKIAADYGTFFMEDTSRWNRSNYVLMGNVAYPMETNFLDGDYRYVNNIIVRAKIGDVDITPDREKLDYNEKTIDFLNGTFNKIADKLKKDTQVIIDTKDFPWEAVSAYSEVSSSFGHNLFKKDLTDFTFDGKPIERIKDEYVKIYTRNRSKWTSSKRIASIQNIDARTVLVAHDTETRIIPSRLSEGWKLEHGEEPSTIIVTNSKNVQDKLFTYKWNAHQIVTDFKALWKKAPKVTRSLVGVYAYPSWHTYNMRYYRELAKDVINNKVYLSTKGNERYPSNEAGVNARNVAKQFDVKYWTINHTKVKNLDSSWKPLEEVIESTVKKIKDEFDHDVYTIGKATQEINDFDDIIMMIKKHKSIFDTNDSDKEATAIFNKFESRHDSEKFYKCRSVLHTLGDTFKVVASDAVKAEIVKAKAFAKKYEIAIAFAERYGHYNSNYQSHIKGIVEMTQFKVDKEAK